MNIFTFEKNCVSRLVQFNWWFFLRCSHGWVHPAPHGYGNTYIPQVSFEVDEQKDSSETTSKQHHAVIYEHTIWRRCCCNWSNTTTTKWEKKKLNKYHKWKIHDERNKYASKFAKFIAGLSSNTIDLQPAIERVAGVQANIAKVRDLASKVNKTNRCVQDQNDGYHAR